MGWLRDNPSIDDFDPSFEVVVEADDPYPPDLLTVVEYREGVRHHMFTDDDGYGHPVIKSGDKFFEDRRHDIIPSMKGADIPPIATHINWFNK